MGTMIGFGSGFSNELGFSDAWSGAFHTPHSGSAPAPEPPAPQFGLPAGYAGTSPAVTVTFAGTPHLGSTFVLDTSLDGVFGDGIAAYSINLTGTSWSGLTTKISIDSEAAAQFNFAGVSSAFDSLVFNPATIVDGTSSGDVNVTGPVGSEDLSNAMVIVLETDDATVQGVRLRLLLWLTALPP